MIRTAGPCSLGRSDICLGDALRCTLVFRCIASWMFPLPLDISNFVIAAKACVDHSAINRVPEACATPSNTVGCEGFPLRIRAMELKEKERRLEEILRSTAPAVIAFSGGVDSSYLAFKSHEVLGDQALAVMAESPSVPSHQRRLAERVIAHIGIGFRSFRSQELQLEAFQTNTATRCYYCKKELFSNLEKIAEDYACATILDGFNADDVNDYRPGRQAGKEHCVRSPLMEAGLTKEDIRELSRQAGLPTADEPASACLASRFPYGIPITEEKLRIVDTGEEYLRGMGFRVFRVRHHDNLARLEFGPDDLRKALNIETAQQLVTQFKRLGYVYVTIDLEGYRTGSANAMLDRTQIDKFRS